MQDIGCGGPQSEMRISSQQSAGGNVTFFTLLITNKLKNISPQGGEVKIDFFCLLGITRSWDYSTVQD